MPKLIIKDEMDYHDLVYTLEEEYPECLDDIAVGGRQADPYVAEWRENLDIAVNRKWAIQYANMKLLAIRTKSLRLVAKLNLPILSKFPSFNTKVILI